MSLEREVAIFTRKEVELMYLGYRTYIRRCIADSTYESSNINWANHIGFHFRFRCTTGPGSKLATWPTACAAPMLTNIFLVKSQGAIPKSSRLTLFFFYHNFMMSLQDQDLSFMAHCLRRANATQMVNKEWDGIVFGIMVKNFESNKMF